MAEKRNHTRQWMQKKIQQLKKRVAELEAKQRQLRKLLKAKIHD